MFTKEVARRKFGVLAIFLMQDQTMLRKEERALIRGMEGE